MVYASYVIEYAYIEIGAADTSYDVPFHGGYEPLALGTAVAWWNSLDLASKIGARLLE